LPPAPASISPEDARSIERVLSRHRQRGLSRFLGCEAPPRRRAPVRRARPRLGIGAAASARSRVAPGGRRLRPGRHRRGRPARSGDRGARGHAGYPPRRAPDPLRRGRPSAGSGGQRRWHRSRVRGRPRRTGADPRARIRELGRDLRPGRSPPPGDALRRLQGLQRGDRENRPWAFGPGRSSVLAATRA
jgi:hypothetical protein